MPDPIRVIPVQDSSRAPKLCSRSVSGQEDCRSIYATGRREAPAAEGSDTCQQHADMLGWL